MTAALLDHSPERATATAMRRGARRRCPACGDGMLFEGYLKVCDACPSCSEAMHHQRADDGPAYLTVLIVAHVMTPLLLIVFVAWRPGTAVMLTGFLVATVVMSLALLSPIKGAMVGLQWARRMHGFGDGDAAAS